jgi:PIN domain nuclease of toxin-antitoxin system
MPSNTVLDASAVLAVANAEAGGERASGFIDSGAAISAVNLSEAVTKLVDRG